MVTLVMQGLSVAYEKRRRLIENLANTPRECSVAQGVPSIAKLIGQRLQHMGDVLVLNFTAQGAREMPDERQANMNFERTNEDSIITTGSVTYLMLVLTS